MKHDRATEVTRQQAALYALGLLTQHEAYCFERHMEECAVCREEFGKLLYSVAQIGLAVSEKEPSRSLRRRLVKRIDSTTRSELFSTSPKEKRPGTDKRNGPVKKSFSAHSTHVKSVFDVKPYSRKTVFFINVAIYVILAVLAAFTFYVRQYVDLRKPWLQSRIEASENELAVLRSQFNAQHESTEKLERVVDLIRKPSVHVAHLKGLPPRPNNTGIVLLDELTGEITVVGAFSFAPQGTFYQLWLSAPSGRVPVGALPSEWNGNILTVIKSDKIPGAVSGITAIVSLESESDFSTRKDPTEPWSASGRFN